MSKHPSSIRPALASLAAVSALAVGLVPAPSRAFCGYYVSSADSALYNQASQVVVVRDGDRTVLTMGSDYKGDPADFAIVVPVPVVLTRDQVRVVDPSVLARLDAFSAPRLVEYLDPDPCVPTYWDGDVRAADTDADAAGASPPASSSVLGVTVEAVYSVGEYEIVILSAEESDGLETWLTQNGYRQPEGASDALEPYIRQGLKFFVARVSLTERAAGEFTALRPLQMDFTSPRFMLPIRLGMVNATGPQDLLIYALTRTGRVELANYRTTRVPTDFDVPPRIEPQFGRFYRDMFQTAHEREGGNVAFTEYFWNMAWCDPCSADPLTPAELAEAGVWWMGQSTWQTPVYVTRLHVRYDPERWPEDLVLRETADQEAFQGKYVMHQPFTGPAACEEGAAYRRQLRERREREAETLAEMTGWDLLECRVIAGVPRLEIPPATSGDSPRRGSWWRRVFP